MSHSPENLEKASEFEAKIAAMTQEFSKLVSEEGRKIGLEVTAEVHIRINSQDD